VKTQIQSDWPDLETPAKRGLGVSRRERLDQGPIRVTRRRSDASPAPSAPARVQAPRVESFPRIEDYLLAYLDGEPFGSAHPLARGRWLAAWQSLWQADSKDRVIAVAGRARVALQAYSASMLEVHLQLAMNARSPRFAEVARRARPLEGLSSIIELYRPQLGEDRCELLRGLLEQWWTLLELIERHEERRQEAGERLRWEDGRRLVLFTALVIVEIDRSFA
jgi:hypothetical protein